MSHTEFLGDVWRYDEPLVELHGCPRCGIVPATAAELSLEYVRSLFDSSHEAFALYRCASCGQAFLYRFCERLNWTSTWGEDAASCSWMPITPAEHHEIDSAFPGREARLAELRLMDEMMRRRGRLVWHPDGYFYWSDVGRAADDLLPPG